MIKHVFLPLFLLLTLYSWMNRDMHLSSYSFIDADLMREDIEIIGLDANENDTDSVSKGQGEVMLNVQIGEQVLKAKLDQNSSIDALMALLEKGPIKVEMQDYANMEKVGSLPESLPRNDRSISAEAGDLILYQGRQFVLYYDENSWSFTRLGHLEQISQKDLKALLGDGDVDVILSLPRE